MKTKDELICEALKWLYGFAFVHEGLDVYAIGGHRVCFSERSSRWYHETDHDDDFHEEDITDLLEYALKITEPWEWGDSLEFTKAGKIAAETYSPSAGWSLWDWKVRIANGIILNAVRWENSCYEAEDRCRDEYLTYMRGRLALKGIEK